VEEGWCGCEVGRAKDSGSHARQSKFLIGTDSTGSMWGVRRARMDVKERGLGNYQQTKPI
jgi:hypothetical protein